MEESQQPFQSKPARNLTFLRILCVLSFIGSGLAFFSFFFVGLLFNFVADNLDMIPDEQNRELFGFMLSGGKSFFLMNALLYAVSFAGVLKMWKLKKAGFHFYTFAQMMILIIPFIFIKQYPFSWTTVIITAAFILAYSGFLKEFD